MKKLLLSFSSKCLLAAFAFVSIGAGAQTYSDLDASITWTVGNEDEGTVSEDAAAAVSSTSFSYGSDLTTSVLTASTLNGKFGEDLLTNDMATWEPGTSNAGNSVDDMLEFSVKLKKGLTFTPTSVSYNAVKNGSDGATYSWSYTLDEEESDITDVDATTVRRDRNKEADKLASINHTEAISEESGARLFTFRIYVSNCAIKKKLSFSNIVINGKINGTKEARSFTDFKVDFRSNPYTVSTPETGLPSTVSISGSYHDGKHGYQNTSVVVPVDGPVKFTIGACSYGSATTIKNSAGDVLASLDTKSPGCDSETSTDKYVTWTYNVEEEETLTIDLGSYCPYFYAEACELLPDYKVIYYNTDGSVIGKEVVQGGSALAYAYSESDVTVPSGKAFRGWFNSDKSTGSKVAEGTSVQANLNLYAKATTIESVSKTARFIYDLTKANFYDEDHEAISMEGGSFHDTTHGWAFSSGGSISIPVAGKAIVNISNCAYSKATATVTDSNDNEVATFATTAESDGSEATIKYDGDETTLKVTFDATAYVHKVQVFNVVDFVTVDESGYYIIPANDVNSFLLTLASVNAEGNAKIFLPDGTYDMGETVLTAISGSNISIVGQSMDNTIIVNSPLVENEGIGTTATFYITGTNTYFQDLTIQNALDYYSSGSAGRAVCIQDKGTKTICKNVKMLSYQDTYYSNNGSGKFYWEDSEIHGTVDYICGGGDAYFNRCLLVNESRSKDSKSGDDVIAAPYTDGSEWGYVFNNCTVENLAAGFSWARAWGGKPRTAFINTTLNQPNEISSTRYQLAGMNVAADKFVEYNTLDVDGNVVSPASNICKFTKDNTTNEMETILTADEAAAYALDKVFTDWTPASDTKQADIAVSLADGVLNFTSEASYFAIFKNGEFVEIVTDKTYDLNGEDADDYTVRAANGRGGFGKAVKAGEDTAAVQDIDAADAEVVSTTIYSLSGARLASLQRGINIVVRTLSNGATQAARVIVK